MLIMSHKRLLQIKTKVNNKVLREQGTNDRGKCLVTLFGYKNHKEQIHMNPYSNQNSVNNFKTTDLNKIDPCLDTRMV